PPDATQAMTFYVARGLNRAQRCQQFRILPQGFFNLGHLVGRQGFVEVGFEVLPGEVHFGGSRVPIRSKVRGRRLGSVLACESPSAAWQENRTYDWRRPVRLTPAA